MTVGEVRAALEWFPDEYQVIVGYESIGRDIERIGAATGWSFRDADRMVVIEADEFSSPP